MSDGYFDGSMPREVLEYYLSRASSAQWIYLSNTLDDDIRAITKAGVKFLGRASGIWRGEMPEEKHFELSRTAAEKIHAADPEIILQACIFEAMYREDVETVKVPKFVFDAFDLPFEDRYFDYDACLFDKETQAEGAWSVMPDISQFESQWGFYYRGVRYID